MVLWKKKSKLFYLTNPTFWIQTTPEEELPHSELPIHCRSDIIFDGVPDSQSLTDPVWRPLPQTTAEDLVSGQAMFIDDMPSYQSKYSYDTRLYHWTVDIFDRYHRYLLYVRIFLWRWTTSLLGSGEKGASKACPCGLVWRQGMPGGGGLDRPYVSQWEEHVGNYGSRRRNICF